MSLPTPEAPWETFPALEVLPQIRARFFQRVPGLDVATDRDSAMARLAGIHCTALDPARCNGSQRDAPSLSRDR